MSTAEKTVNTPVVASTLFIVKGADSVALQQMKTGTKIIRTIEGEQRYIRVGLTMDKGKYFTSDRNSDAGTGVLFDYEESSLESVELTAGVLAHAAPRVQIVGRSFWVFISQDRTFDFFEDANKTTPMIFDLEHEQLVAQLKNVLAGKVQKQWSATKTDLKDLRK